MFYFLWKAIWKSFSKLNIYIYFDLAILFKDFILRSFIYVLNEHVKIFVAALFVIAKNWKKPKYKSVRGVVD